MYHLAIAFILLLSQVLNVSNNVIFQLNGQAITSVNRNEFHSTIGRSLVDHQKLDEFVDKVNEQIRKEPVNAYIDDLGAIKPEQLGYKLDPIKFREAFYNYYYSKGPATVEIPTSPLYPKVDSELLANICVKQIGSYVTYFNKRKVGRVKNITLAADAINNLNYSYFKVKS